MTKNNQIDSTFVTLFQSNVLRYHELQLYLHLYTSHQNAMSQGELYCPRQEDLAIFLDCHQSQISKRLKTLDELGFVDLQNHRLNGVKICVVTRPDTSLKLINEISN